MSTEKNITRGKPTYRLDGTTAENWEELKRQAAVLTPEDRRRHGSVSKNNAHQCRECFCCACVAVDLEGGAA